MKTDYTKIIPKRYHNVSYEKDIVEGIKEIVKKQLQSGNGLYIRGEVGCGKTHLACAIAKDIMEFGVEVRFFNTSEFLEKLREEFRDNPHVDEDSLGLFRDIMDFKGVLILDDIGTEKVSDWVNERLYLIINKRYEEMLPTIFTSNCDMEILSARLGDRFSSRIGQMTEIINLTSPDRRVMTKI